MDIITKKTSTAAILPISDEALQLCGDRSEGIVFNGLTPGLIASHLKEWISASGITKHITFHTSRHTFATLLISAGSDLYTVSELLGHTSIKTTQIYADVLSETKLDAVNRVTSIFG